MEKVKVKSVLTKQKKRDEWFLCDYSLNPYYGCSFNCLYCYIRGSKYGKNVTEGFALKSNAREVLEKQLARRAKRGEYGIIAFASATDPYLPLPEGLALTRDLLTIIRTYHFPVEISTKSTLVIRDLDVLKQIDETAILPADLREVLNRGVIISFSFSTLDEALARILEPGAASPGDRLEALRACKEKGFLTGATFIPVLPFISDSEDELDSMIGAAKEYGADYVLVGGLTLFGDGPNDCKTLYYQFLANHYPELIPKYRSLYRIFHYPDKTYTDKLAATAAKLCRKHGVRNTIIERNSLH
jgi:DNA repair photolyase